MLQKILDGVTHLCCVRRKVFQLGALDNKLERNRARARNHLPKYLGYLKGRSASVLFCCNIFRKTNLLYADRVQLQRERFPLGCLVSDSNISCSCCCKVLNATAAAFSRVVCLMLVVIAAAEYVRLMLWCVV